MLHVSPGFGWRGGQNQTRLLMKHLREVPGVAQRIVAIRDTPMQRVARELGVPCLPVRRRLAMDPDLVATLARESRDHHVFHAHGSHAVQAAVTALALSGGTARLVSARRVQNPLRSPGVWRRSDLILAVSRAVRRSLLARGVEPGRVLVVPDGIDPAEVRARRDGVLREAAGARPGELLVGAVGALEAEKDHRTLVRAAGRVLAAFPDARFVIAGEGSRRAALERLVRELGVADRVALPGHVTDVRHSLGDLDLFVMPSVEEGLGSAALEALAAGLPVVLSRVGGLVDVAGGRLPSVPPGDPRALADAILRLLESSHERRRAARIGERRLESFTSVMMAARTLGAYRAVVRRDARERAIVRRHRVGRA